MINYIDVKLPSAFSYKTAKDLVRLGKDNDGGYLVSLADIEKSDALLSLGINDDWSFEEDFLKSKNNKLDIIAYDASINTKEFIKKFFLSFIRIQRKKLPPLWLVTIYEYLRFFSQPNVNHVQKYVGFNQKDGGNNCSLASVLANIKHDKFYLKADIEGAEYRLLDTIIENQERLTGLTIEFHDCDIHLPAIINFMDKLSLNLVHIHPSNNSPVVLETGVPLVMELTFSKYAERLDYFEQPHKLDMINNLKKPEMKLEIEE